MGPGDAFRFLPVFVFLHREILLTSSSPALSGKSGISNLVGYDPDFFCCLSDSLHILNMGCLSTHSQPLSDMAIQQRSTDSSEPTDPQQQTEQVHTNQSSEEPICKAPRRFLAQPIETTSRSSQVPSTPTSTANPAAPNEAQSSPQQKENVKDNPPPPRRRFLPEPIETTTRTSSAGSSSTKPRRFTPEIIETERRSVDPDQPPNRYNARAPVGHLGLQPERSRSPARLTPNRAIPHPIESKFSYANLLRRQDQSRRHSFRVPELPSIASDSSEESDTASESRSVSPSPKKRPTKTAKFQQDNSTGDTLQESGDSGEFSDYLLSLAARSAEQQLKDQALAAFPNEQVYQHFDHFAIDDEAPSRNSDEEENWMYPPKHHLKSRRQSSADLTWELEHLRHHKEEAEQRSRVMTRRRKPDLKLSEPKRLGPTPPMLGGDIILPQSLSPIGSFSKNNGSQSESNPCTDCGALWCGPSRPDNGRGSGLWMGTCQKDEESTNNRGSQIMTGIMTPMIRDEIPPSLSPSPNPSHTQSSSPDAHAHARAARREEQGHPARSAPRSVPSSSPGLGLNLNLNLNTVSSIEDEFNDEFVTQIYNYLSLGYPCVARYYDHELSKISGIPVDDMRQDDLHTDAKGYVMAPENEFAVACTRWKALRLYIQEWARQQPNMVEEKKWGVGVPERRGSWAF